MLFKDQIEKRKELEQAALQEAVDELVSAAGLQVRNRRKPRSDGHALKDILNALGIKEYTLEEDEFTSPEEQLDRILHRAGIMQRHIRLAGKWWRETTGPLLGRDKEGRFVALLPSRRGNSYTFIDKTGKRVSLNRRRMAKELDEQAVCFYPPLPRRKLTYRDLLAFIFASFRWSDVVMLLAVCLVVSLFGMFVPFINKQIFEDIIPNGTQEDILAIGGVLIGAGMGSILFGVTRNLILTRFKDLADIRVQSAVMARTFLLRPDFFLKYSSGELSDRITGISRLCDLLNDVILSASLTMLFSIVYIGQMMLYASSLLLPALAILLAQLLLMVASFWLESKYHSLYLQANTKLSGLVFNILSGIQKIKLTGSEKRAFTRWAEAYRTSAAIEYNPPLFLKISPALSALCTLGGTAILYYYTLKGGIAPSDFIAFTVAYGMVSGAVSAVAGIIPSLAQVGPLLRISAPVMESLPEVEEQASQVSFLSGSIEVSNLSFRYAEDAPLVLDGIDLKIRSGEYVGIVGKSGCGKSTLLRLLLGFEEPLSGAVYYDDYDLGKVDKSSLRRCIGTCLQSGSLFPGDVFSNITITAPWSTEEDAWEAARLAGIDKDISELPMGMHTLISEGGGGFSGGQKQRLLIARSLLNKPSVVFFDEATSALDNISQKQVSDNLDTLGCTRVVIAHRFSTIRHCHRIIVLDKGRIAEEGTFDELMANGKLFYEMSKRQL
ncbi:ATP-binding cassette domain-containing protein [Phocaeicola sp.]